MYDKILDFLIKNEEQLIPLSVSDIYNKCTEAVGTLSWDETIMTIDAIKAWKHKPAIFRGE